MSASMLRFTSVEKALLQPLHDLATVHSLRGTAVVAAVGTVLSFLLTAAARGASLRRASRAQSIMAAELAVNRCAVAHCRYGYHCPALALRLVLRALHH